MIPRHPSARPKTQPLRPRAIAARFLLLVVGGALAASAGGTAARAQAPTAPTSAHSALPEPIHWKQDLFLIPYAWSARAGGDAAQAVWLLASKDRGATWQRIAEAAPHVKAFNYRAEREGEYWFALRTIDRFGRAWPEGPYQPELRVIVDKSPPQIDALSGHVRGDGALQIEWRASDQHLDAASWRFEVRAEGEDKWQPVAPPAAPMIEPGLSTGKAAWFAPPDRKPVALRATIFDMAGNATVHQADVAPAPPTASATESAPAISAPATAGWTAASAAPGIASTSPPIQPPNTQLWPKSEAARGPYRLYTAEAQLATDGVTRYGYLESAGSRSEVADLPSEGAEQPLASGTDAHGADSAQPDGDAQPDAAVAEERRPFTPLQPFRQASLRRLPPVGEPADAAAVHDRPAEPPLLEGVADAPPLAQPGPPASENEGRARVALEPKRVPSRTFVLDYELEDVGRWGISHVELWGTRNGGNTWRRYAQDDDLRSPIQVTVEEEGLYGFCIVVEGAGGMPAPLPHQGDAPELWVEVDLHRPFAELTSVEPGSGNQADHLLLRWRAADDHLAAQPISLFYSSRPAGPWSVIAANLENTGVYAWRLERHIPERCYLRLEVRDLAGNLAAFQTLEPVTIDASEPSARFRTDGPQ